MSQHTRDVQRGRRILQLEGNEQLFLTQNKKFENINPDLGRDKDYKYLTNYDK